MIKMIYMKITFEPKTVGREIAREHKGRIKIMYNFDGVNQFKVYLLIVLVHSIRLSSAIVDF